MSILSGYGKFKRYILTDDGYKLCSQWTSSNTVHFDDGNTAQTKLGAISGITDSLTSTSSNVALSAKSGKNLQDQITELNTGKAASSHTHDDRYYTESEMNTKLASKSDSGHTHSYLPLSGGTLTGNLTISNGKVLLPGDSCIAGSGGNNYALMAFRQNFAWILPGGWPDSTTIARSIRIKNEVSTGYGFVAPNGADNYYDLGVSGSRWKQIYAVNSAISTSDENQKKILLLLMMI